MDLTGSGLNNEATKTEQKLTEVKKTKSTEEVGFLTRFATNKMVEWTTFSNTSFDGSKVQPIDGSWSGLLYDISRYLIIDQAKLGDNKLLISNVTHIVEHVLLALATMRSGPDQPVQFDNPQFVKNLTVNILKIILARDLSQYNPEAPPNSKEGKELRKELAAVFEDLLKCAGLDEANKDKLPYAVRQILYPDLLVQAAKGVYGIYNFFSKKKGEEDVSSISREALEKIFVDRALDLLTIQKRMEVKSKDPILDQNEGSSQAVDDLVEKKILKKLRGGELAFKFTFLKSSKNEQFLNSVLNEMLGDYDPKNPENKEIIEAWEMIEHQLKLAIKSILAIVLQPAAHQTAEERRDALLVNIVNKVEVNSDSVDKKSKQIEKLNRDGLKKELKRIKDFKEGPYTERAKELYKRKNLPWKEEALAFINSIWEKGVEEQELSPEDLIKKLKSWEQEKEKNPHWRAAHSDKAQILLKRAHLNWEDEARQFLKKIEYTKAAHQVLKDELNPKKFEGLIPKFFKVQDVFQEIYESIGETAFEFHEQQKILTERGKEALSFITNSSIPGLAKFIDELMEGALATIEDQAEKNEINLEFGKFFDEMVEQVLKEDIREGFLQKNVKDEIGQKLPVNGCKVAKEQIIGLIKNILMIVVKHTIQSNTTKECPEEQAFSNLIENFVKNTVDGLEEISELCAIMKEMSLEEKEEGVKDLAQKLGIKNLKLDETVDDPLLEQYRILLVKLLARNLIQQVMPKKIFNALLPPMFRKAKLWEIVTDDMVASYMEGISKKLDAFKVDPKEEIIIEPEDDIAKRVPLTASNKDSKGRKRLKLIGDAVQLSPLIEPMTAKAVKYMSEIKLTELFKQEKGSKLSKVNFEVLDDLFGKVFQKGGQLNKLVESVLPPIIESIIALHVNPKDGKSSQDLATELMWNVLMITQGCYDRLDGIKTMEIDLQALQEEFEDAEELHADVIKKTLETYRKEKEIDSDDASILQDAEFYTWLKMNREMNVALKELLNLIIPEDLWDVFIPKQFESFITREKIGNILFDYIKEGYEHSNNIQDLVLEAKVKLDKEDHNQDEKELGLKKFIADKVVKGLKDVAKPDVNEDEESTLWIKGVLRNLLEKKTAEGDPLFVNVAINIVYAIFGKLLSGGLTALNKAPGIVKLGEDDLSLMGKISKMIPRIRDNLKKLNELEEGQHISKFLQVTPENIKGHLSLSKALKENEIIEKENLPEILEIKEGVIGFKVRIKNTKTNTEREEFINIVRFVYWEMGYQAINQFITDEDWKKLMPSFMRPVMTKEIIAEFIVPYVQSYHQIQEPLQRKAEAGQKLVDELVAEDPQGGLQEFIDQKIIGNIFEVLNEMGEDTEKLNNDLPDALDTLAKDILKTETNEEVAELKEMMIERVVYLLASELLRPALKHTGGEIGVTATEQSVENILSKLRICVHAYKTSKKDPKEMTRVVLEEVLSEQTWDEIFTGKFKNLISRKSVIDLVEVKMKQLYRSADRVKHMEIEALRQIKTLDRLAGLEPGVEGGLEKMLQTLCQSINATIDEYAVKEEKVFEEQPLLINALTKSAFDDPEISKAIKDTSRALMTICLAKLVEGNPDKAQEHLLEVMGNLFNAYNSDDPVATAQAWLEQIVPDDLLKEIVPPFLQKTITHTFLAKMVLKDYVSEVKDVEEKLKKVPKDNKEQTISRMQRLIKNILVKYKDPEHSKSGITNFGGFVKSIEMAIIGAMAGDEKWKNFEGVAQKLEAYLNSFVAQILSGEQMTKVLDKRFLSDALIKVLPLFGSVDPENDLDHYPALKFEDFPDISEKGIRALKEELKKYDGKKDEAYQLKKLIVELKRFSHESDDSFKQRILNKYYDMKCGQLATEIIFPQAEDLLVPKVAQPFVYSNIQEALANQIGALVNRNERILFAIDFLSVDASDKMELNLLNDHLKTLGTFNSKEEKTAERLFKKRLTSFVMKIVEENVASTWIQPFKWIAQGIVKLGVRMVLAFGIRDQIWKFISNEKNDDTFRYVIWGFLTFAKGYDPEIDAGKRGADDLENALKDGLKNMKIFKGMHSRVASTLTNFLSDKNLVDLIAPA